MANDHELSERDRSEKAPADDSFDALLKRAAHVSAPAVASLGAQLRAGSTLLEGRLRVVRRIGEGGMGVVYEAHDVQRNGSVALKTLSRLDAGSVYRLKNEFRSLVDVSHPNLCRLHELFGEAGQWFFTMELIHGERFDQWVRPSGVLDEARLRDALPQLCEGVAAIHASGKLHRDLKPSNVLVARDGRVVVLDFGLAVDPELGGVGQTVIDESVSGTPAYMAPEQAAGLAATSASDFYALGVMLFEALTGKLPFSGRTHEMLVDKQRSDAPRANASSPNAAADLDELCSRLLSREASARPDIIALRSAVGHSSARGDTTTRVRASSVVRTHSASTAPDAAPELLGRDAELQALRDAYAQTITGKSVVLFVSGESGMGKSALVTAFVDELRAAGHATVLAGRCYERENVPFKGFDSIVDELSRHLRKLPALEAMAVLPREVFALARVFPVLDRVAVVAEAPKRDVPDPNDLKRRAFEAFGELLARMRDRAPLVLFIDDVQWLDQDSVRFMRALFVHADPVPALLICAHRSERAADNALLQSVLQAASDNRALHVRSLEVGRLPASALTALAQRLLPGTHDTTAARAFADEAQGSPFFAAELARAASALEAGAPLPSLADALARHIAALPNDAQRLLSVLALAGQPLSPAIAAQAVKLSDGHAALDELRTEQLVRVSINADGVRKVECYHDKIREHVVGALDALDELAVRELALGLSRALLADADSDPELLARCLDLAGLPEQAAVHAAHAAKLAFTALAFDRAATLFERALARGRFEHAETQALRIQTAEALSAAGQGERSGEAYLAAAQGEEGEPARQLILKAGEQFLVCGDLERGRKWFGDALRPLGLRLPQTRAGALASVVWSRARLRLRSLSFTPREHHDGKTLLELEALRIAANCFARSDQVLGADFCARWVLRALDVGHAVEVTRALSSEILFSSMGGAPEAYVDKLIALCAPHCERPDADTFAQSAFYIYRGVHQLIRLGDIERARIDLEAGLHANAAMQTATSSFDRTWVQFYRSVSMFYAGDFVQALELARSQLEDARARGDEAVCAALTTIVCVGLLALDQADLAERVCAESVAQLRAGEVTAQDFSVTGIMPVIDVYRGRGRDAWYPHLPRLERLFTSFQGRFVMRGSIEGMVCGIPAALARTAVDDSERRKLTVEAERLAKRARSARTVNTPIVPSAVIACLREDRAGAVKALRKYLTEIRVPLYTQIARRRLGELLNDDEGRALIAEADAFMRAGGVVHPERLAAAFMPGIELR